MPTVRDVLKPFGRPNDLARLAGVGHTAVQYWFSCETLPPGRVMQLEDLARTHGIAVDVEALRSLARRPDRQRAA